MRGDPIREDRALASCLDDAAQCRRMALRSVVSYVRQELDLAHQFNEQSRRATSPGIGFCALVRARAIHSRVEATLVSLPLSKKRRGSLEREVAAIAAEIESAARERS